MGDAIRDEPVAAAVIERLTLALGRDAIVLPAEDPVAAYDGLSGQRGFTPPPPAAPICIVQPLTRDDVVAIVRIAAEFATPIVPYGGGSGLMGGARSVRPGIVLDMKRMAHVRAIDTVSRTVSVEAGAVLSDVDDALRPHGLMIGHDPWTYGIATVGGTISTNGLGFLAGKYGSMGEQTLGIEAVTVKGAVIVTRAVETKSVGFDLARLFVGGEGEFGILTAATLRVFPIPESRRRAGFTFPTFERGFDAILAMHAVGIAPALLDFGERPASASVARWSREPEPPTLYMGFDGLREEVDVLLARAAAICEQHEAEHVADDEVEEFWTERHAPAENFARNRAARGAQPSLARASESRCFDYVHVALPPSRVLEYRAEVLRIAEQHGVHVLETGVWVRPGLFSLALAATAASSDDGVARMAASVDACVRAAHALGGSMEYCHGVGVRLAHLMREEHGAGLDVMRTIKRALDPNVMLNPNKLALDP
jgi:FAD/FMN-containing dehydrogenase